MKLLKPNWVSHDGKPVFSVHFHPDGSRFATGGQGGDAGLVAVWNMEPIRSEKAEEDDKVPKLLCSMTNHLSCVNCVRWSNEGKYLASGSDDNDVMIWRCSGSGKQGELWSCAHILRQHGGDVLDLAWSPDDSYLATGSVDNAIVIWIVDSFSGTPEVKAKIVNHSGMVKGVAWDPMGKYLASQSDDKSLRVWRTSDWKEEAAIRGPFDKCGAVTHVLRLGWSPDGQYVVSTHALNNDGPVAKIVERGSWKACMDFVGHRKAVEVVSFNPKLLRREGGAYTCCAVGSRDRTLSIWLTCHRRPLVVLHDVFSNSIMDISWGGSGLELLVCSHDGTVAYISMSQKEIGTRLSDLENKRTLKSLYGFAPGRVGDQGANALIENPNILKLRQGADSSSKDSFGNHLTVDGKKIPATPTSAGNSRSQPSTPQSSIHSTPMLATPTISGLNIAPVQNFSSSSQPASVAVDTVKQQQETRTKEGRRRIAPVLLLSKTTASNIPAPFGSSVAPATDSTPPKATGVEIASPHSSPARLDVERRMSFSPPEKVAAQTPSAATATAQSANGTGDAVHAASTPTTTATAPGADKPMSIQPLSPEKQPASVTTAGAGRGKRKQSAHDSLPAKRVRKEPSATKAASTGAATTVDSSAASRHGAAAGPSSLANSATSATVSVISQTNVFSQPEIKSSLALRVSCLKGGDMVFETKNTLGSQANLITCSQDGQQLWQIGSYSRIVVLAASRHCAGVATEDKCLTLLSAQGRRLLPPMCLSGCAHMLSARDHYVAVVTTGGKAFVWDCRTLKQVVRSDSVANLLNVGERLSSLDISSTGHPLLTVSSLRTYLYSSDMEAWLLLSDHEDPINRLSSYAVRKSIPSGAAAAAAAAGGAANTPGPAGVKGVGDLRPLARLQGLVCADGNREAAMRAGSLLRQDATQTRLANQAFLEHQLASALALESHTEYRLWLMAYARYLTQEGMEATLKDVCSSLMKGLHSSSATYDQLFILGLSKKRLLKDVLVTMATNISLQRCVAQLQEQLEALPSHQGM